jgi:hypothetical protein
MQRNLASLCASCVIACIPWQAAAACLDVRQSTGLIFEGFLAHHIFPGPPNYEDVRRGDQPEPAYILQLDQPVCATGDEFVNENKKIDRVQIYPGQESSTSRRLWKEMRRMVGQRVSVEGKSAFGAHTAHHHAPLLLPIDRIARIRPNRGLRHRTFNRIVP